MHYDDHLSPEEASRYLRLSLNTVYKLIRQSDLLAVKKGRFWKIKRSDLEEFAEYQGEREEFPD